jgi:hypothetical protein
MITIKDLKTECKNDPRAAVTYTVMLIALLSTIYTVIGLLIK